MARTGTAGVLLGSSLSTAHTIGIGVEATLMELLLTNHDTVNRRVEVQFIKTGQPAAANFRVIDQGTVNALTPGESQIYRFNQFLKVGDFIQWKADVAVKVMARLSILEEAPKTGVSRINIDGILLPSTLAIGHTINSSVQSTLIELILCNTDTVLHRVDFHLVPSGGTPDNTNKVIGQQAGNNELEPGESQIYRYNQFLDDGATLRWKADAASQIAAKLSIQEENV